MLLDPEIYGSPRISIFVLSLFTPLTVSIEDPFYLFGCRHEIANHSVADILVMPSIILISLVHNIRNFGNRCFAVSDPAALFLG